MGDFSHQTTDTT